MIERVEKSNKIYPIYYGLSSDLVFWIAINTLFLSTVKNLSAFQINSLTTISTILSIVLYFFASKIINKIGNITSVRLANLLLLLSSLLLTFSKSYFLLLLGQILYEFAFVFKAIDSVILIKNLKYLKKEEKYLEIKNKGTTIYSLITMIISLISGFLFNINPYLPMFICVFICTINLILSMFIVEADIKEEPNTKTSVKISKLVVYIILIYGLLYGIIVIGQNNAKLFMQYRLNEVINIEKTAIILSFIVFASRLVRLISNLTFMKIYNVLKNKIIILMEFLLLVSYVLFVIGNFIRNGIIAALIMAIGFIIFLWLRDPIENFLTELLMKNTKVDEREQTIIYFQFFRKLITFLLSMIATLILLRFEMVYIYGLFTIIVFMYIPLIINFYKLLK